MPINIQSGNVTVTATQSSTSSNGVTFTDQPPKQNNSQTTASVQPNTKAQAPVSKTQSQSQEPVTKVNEQNTNGQAVKQTYTSNVQRPAVQQTAQVAAGQNQANQSSSAQAQQLATKPQQLTADKQVAASGNVNPATPIKTYDGLKEQTFTTDKAVYNPGDTVKINLGLQNNQKFDQWGTYKVNVYNPLTNEKTVASGSWKTAKNGGTDNINVDWVTPKIDNQGYIINVQLYTSTGALLDEFDNAVDVDSDPYRHPRYGALTDFSGNDIQSELGSVDSFAKNYHLDMQMLYDCYFRPQNPIPSNMSSWTDWHNDNISKNAIQQIVNRIHQDGSKAWLYDMINAITGKPGDANADLNGIGATEQNGQVVTQTGLFYPKGSSQAGQQYHVTLGNNSDTDIQWYNDPANPQWQNYFIPKIKAALKEIGFDGWQGDTNGQMIGTTYQNRNTNKTINDADFYYYFVQAVEKAFGNQYGFGLNAVNNVGQNSIATKSKPTIDYTELWPDSFPTYGDIANVIEKNWQNDGKPLVVPAYFMDQWRNNASSGKGDALPKTYNDNAVRQLIATIMANGGSPMVLSDGGYLLDDEYYPWPRLEKGKQINMDNNLGNPINGYMRHYWDFDTGYENLLQNPALKSNNNYIQVWNGNGVNQGQCINKNDAESNTVYAFSKSNGSNLDTLNLVNLMGSTNKWQVYNNQDNNSHNIQPQKNLWIKYYPSEQNANIKHVYVSSPDPYYQGKRIELPFKEYTDPSGHKYVEFEVPSLNVWDLVYMTTTDPQNTIAGQTTPSTNKPSSSKPTNSTTNNKPNASQSKPASSASSTSASGSGSKSTSSPSKNANPSGSKANGSQSKGGQTTNIPTKGVSGSGTNNAKPTGQTGSSVATNGTQSSNSNSGKKSSVPSMTGSKNSGTNTQSNGTNKVSGETNTSPSGTSASANANNSNSKKGITAENSNKQSHEVSSSSQSNSASSEKRGLTKETETGNTQKSNTNSISPNKKPVVQSENDKRNASVNSSSLTMASNGDSVSANHLSRNSVSNVQVPAQTIVTAGDVKNSPNTVTSENTSQPANSSIETTAQETTTVGKEGMATTESSKDNNESSPEMPATGQTSESLGISLVVAGLVLERFKRRKEE